MASAPGKHYGGHEHKFVGETIEKFTCNICAKVQRDPHLTSCCGQHFCESCLNHWFKKRGKKVCPHCRDENFIHIINKAHKREIDKLKIYCTHSVVECQWVGELCNLQTHLNSVSGCGYVEVECPNKCKEPSVLQLNDKIRLFKRKDLQEHCKNECPLRRYKCKHCGLVDTYKAITGRGGYYLPSGDHHYAMCPNFPLDCPNDCGVRAIKRKDMTTHRNKCLKELVVCPNKCRISSSSTRQVMRIDLQKHLSSECYLRQYKCKYCGHESTYQAITGKYTILGYVCHHDQCLEYPLVCRNQCGERAIKRKDMPVHRDKCPLELIKCPFGCEDSVVRKNISDHMAIQSQEHLLLTFQKMQSLTKTCDTLSKRCDELERERDMLKEELQKLKVKK